ncbi:MAG TPA: SBBP repeat-containing protein [Gemmatimonadaceae bacterium]|nr:SBBP repeat-containing protein [Gemmatimonadaceae bacterium]
MGRTLGLTLLAMCLSIATLAQTTNTKPTVTTVNTLPISFEENRGQVDSAVQYLAHMRHSAIFFTPEEVVLTMNSSSREHDVADLRMKWVGGNDAAIAAENQLAGKINYLIGSDPSKWHTDLPTYSRIRYRGLYRGVDAVFYGNEGKLEFDLVVAPGADYKSIRFAYEGARAVRIAKNGDLLIKLEEGELRQHMPKVYQKIAGKERVLAASYVIHEDNTVGFRVLGVDSSRPLVIDPTLSYSTYIGSSTFDTVNGVSVDQFGRAYITGTTTFGFPTKNPAQGNKPGQDAFVTKFTATGGGLIYSTFIGGSGEDSGVAIAIDRFGNAYVGGNTGSGDFPTTPGAFHTQLRSIDVFVTKLSPSGSSLVYSLVVGSEEFADFGALALDSQQRVYITGATCSSAFPTRNAFIATYPGQPCSSGGESAFVTRFNTAGSDLDYSTYLDGGIASGGRGIAVDSTFHAYVTGFTSSPDFPTTAGAFQRIFRAATIPGDPHDTPGRTTFVTKFAPDGMTLSYSTFLGGTSNDIANGIAVDSSDRAYVTGIATSANFPVKAGGFQTTLRGGGDAFVTKLQKDGAGLIYSTFLGGNGGDGGNSIAVDSFGQAHVVGGTSSSATFPLRNAIQAKFGGGANDAFITKLAASGASLIYSTYLGGSSNDSANCVRLDNSNAAYVAGITSSSNFPTTVGAFSRTYKGSTDGWVAKIKP